MPKPDDLTICRSVRYTKGPRKGAKKCGQCGFYFLPDEQQYPKAEYALGVESPYLTGVEWFAQYGCCPNCLPGKRRRCLGQRHHGVFSDKRGCGIWFSNPARRKDLGRRSRVQCCRSCRLPNRVERKARTRQLAISVGLSQVLELGRCPTCTEWDHLQLYPSSSTIADAFGAWSSFQLSLGIAPRHSGQRVLRRGSQSDYSDNDVLITIRSVYEKYGKVISRRMWEKLKIKPSTGLLKHRYGSYNNAWTRAGYVPNQAGCEHLLKWMSEHKPSPTSRQVWEAAFLDRVKALAEEQEAAEQRWKDHKFKKKEQTDEPAE